MTEGVRLPSHALDASGQAGREVRWTVAAPGDEARLAPWRRAVGPPWALAPSGEEAQVDADPLRGALVVVWNLRVGGGGIRTFWEHVVSLAEGRPVVLLLQEAYSTGP
ncbi:MAG: hypothetical protein HKO53_14030, partial [Gemmatimonadetes bacterium]|nr:hypothetical protein [Gemmatimonadota bacterium]